MTRAILHAGITLLLTTASASWAALRTVSAESAREVIGSLPSPSPLGAGDASSTIRLTGVRDLETGEALDLLLAPFELVAPGARLIVRGAGGETEELLARGRYLRGSVAGAPDSLAYVALHGKQLRGLIADAAGVRMLGFGSAAARAAGTLEARRVHPLELARGAEGFRCAADAGFESPPEASTPVRSAAYGAVVATDAISPLSLLGVNRTAVYAIETDFEFYDLFDDVGETATYILDLMGFISTLYAADTSTSILVGTVYVYSNPSDPWSQSNPQCALLEFGRYWNNNRSGVERTAVAMLSGKNNGGGIAWLNGLCSGSFNVDHAGTCAGLSPQNSNYGGGYAYLGQMSGGFDIDNPQAVWDLFGLAHEIGHNFGSPHSHCFRAVDGSDQIDRCYTQESRNLPGNPDSCTGAGATQRWVNSGCACGSTALPGVGTTTGGASGQSGGTIMSYCHLLAGGFGNVALNFGVGQTRGFQAIREANLMTNVAAASTSCVDFGLFLDGFATSDTGRWSDVQP